MTSDEKSGSERRSDFSALLTWSCVVLGLVCLDFISAQTSEPLKYRIVEELPPDTFIANLIDDLRLNRRYSSDVIAQLEFRILPAGAGSPGGGTSGGTGGIGPGAAAALFTIGTKTGIVTTGSSAPLDREAIVACRDRDVCEVTIDVAIKPAQYFQIVKVTVEIIDVNDNSPQFREKHAVVSVRESAAIGSPFALPIASDLDSPSFGIHRYELRTPKATSSSSSSSSTGAVDAQSPFGLSVTVRRDGSLDPRLIVEKTLDRETVDYYTVQLIAYDGGSPSRSAVIDLTVSIQDSNDNSPVFDAPPHGYSVNISENLAVGTRILRVHAVDRDVGVNAVVQYRLSAQTRSLYGHLFTVDSVTGDISVRGPIDYETSPIYQLSIVGQDQGPDSSPIDTAVVVRVIDVNDNSPSIIVNTLSSRRTNNAEVMENLPMGTFVAHVSVSDPDSGPNGRITCNISDPAFVLVERYPTEYQVTTTEQLDREFRAQYDAELMCWDAGQPSLSTRKVLPVRVLDANDNRPTFTSATYTARLQENSYVGTVVLQVTARDMDIGANGEFRYLLAPGVESTFDIGASGMIVAKIAVDREQYSSFSFTVLAVDQGSPSLTGTALVLITIDDVNDESPRFSADGGYSFSVAEGEPDGTPVGRVSAEDRDAPGPNNVVRYSFFATGQTAEGSFAIDADTGNIYTSSELDRESESVYLFVILASDGGRPALSSTSSVTVYVLDKNDNQPIFDFPNAHNDTIHISNRVPLGAAIGRVWALDLDLDNNARLTYQLRGEGNDDGAFSIDPDDGSVSVNVRLTHVQFYVYELSIVASDHGYPVGWARTTLRICVNSSIPYVPGGGGGAVGKRTQGGEGEAEEGSELSISSQDSTFNLAIIVTLACGCAVVVVILLVFIAAVRQHNRRRKSLRYKARMEALRALTAKELMNGGGTGQGTGEGGGGGSGDRNGGKSGIGNDYVTNSNDVECRTPLTSTPVARPDVAMTSSVTFSCATLDRQRNGHVGPEAAPFMRCSASEHHLPPSVHQLIPESERESMHSGEGSNADSGHGHSEEDEMERARHLLNTNGGSNITSGGPYTGPPSRGGLWGRHGHALPPPPPPRSALYGRMYPSSTPSPPCIQPSAVVGGQSTACRSTGATLPRNHLMLRPPQGSADPQQAAGNVDVPMKTFSSPSSLIAPRSCTGTAPESGLKKFFPRLDEEQQQEVVKREMTTDGVGRQVGHQSIGDRQTLGRERGLMQASGGPPGSSRTQPAGIGQGDQSEGVQGTRTLDRCHIRGNNFSADGAAAQRNVSPAGSNSSSVNSRPSSSTIAVWKPQSTVNNGFIV